MKTKIKILSAFFLVFSLMIFSGCGCKLKNTANYTLKLEVWGFLDDRDALAEIFQSYSKINRNVSKIEYRKLSTDTYKKEVLEALASGQGPDIFLINNAWMASFSDKVVPAPIEIINEQKLRKDFVDVVAADFLMDGKVYALPLSVDSIGLYYNKDLFNQAGITAPPKDWVEFQEDVAKLTKINSFGEITQAGAAFGTAYNINRSTDLLNLLMLQNGTRMISDSGAPDFDSTTGENALSFYTQFAKSGSPYYTWNTKMHYSIDAFSEGTVAMMLNYSWHIPTIKEKSPKLNFAIAPVPQFSGGREVNYANYWGYVVARNKIIPADQPGVTNDIRAAEAWKFLAFLTTKPERSIEGSGISALGGGVDPNFDPAFNYLQKTRRPSGRRDIIEKQKSDPEIGVFAEDNLIDASWRQADAEANEAIFAAMIDDVNRGQFSINDAMDQAAQRIGKIIYGR